MKTLALIFLLFILVIGLSAIFPNGCTQPDETRRVLAAHGYRDIEITGYRAFMGGQDDVYSTGFKAVSPAGVPVTGAVTSGAFKGHTIRLD